jgi:acyl carrier protein
MAGATDMTDSTDSSDSSRSLQAEVKQAIVRSLRLPIAPEEIDTSTPLFGDGLGLDSIDVLELVLELERGFGVSISDEQTGTKVLYSVETIASFIIAERRKNPA